MADGSSKLENTNTKTEILPDKESDDDDGSYIADKSHSSGVFDQGNVSFETTTPSTLPDFNLEVLNSDHEYVDDDDQNAEGIEENVGDNDDEKNSVTKEVVINDNAGVKNDSKVEEDDKVFEAISPVEGDFDNQDHDPEHINENTDDHEKNKTIDETIYDDVYNKDHGSENVDERTDDYLNDDVLDEKAPNMDDEHDGKEDEELTNEAMFGDNDVDNKCSEDNQVDDADIPVITTNEHDNLAIETTYEKRANIKDKKEQKDEENEKLKTEASATEAEKSDDVNSNAKVKAEEQKEEKKEKQKEEVKEEKSEITSKVVDLKKLQAHYKTHTKSTLPHILAEYGLEDKDHPAVVKEEKPNKKKKKRPQSTKEDTDDDDRQRRKAKDEKFRQTFGDNRQAVDQYYIEYLDFLEQRVADQRVKAQKQKEEEAKQAAARAEDESFVEEKKKLPPLKEQENREDEDIDSSTAKEKKRHKLHHLPRKLERIELKHDDTFLKDLPKTDVARIIALQDRMKKDGKLKYQSEVDKFWSDIRKPDVFYAQFKVKKVPETKEPESDMNRLGQKKVLDMPPRSLSHISEKSNSDKEPWAITQKFQSSNGPKTPTGDKGRKDSAQLAKEAALDLEIRCPKLEMPPLACFSLKLGEKPPDPEEIQRKIELKAREKSRKKSQRKLQRMYQMAMTHSAAANRILSQHGDLTNVLEGAALRDVRDFCCEPKELGVFDEPDPYMLDEYYRDIADPSRTVEVHPEMIGGSEASHSQPSTRQSSAGSHRLEPLVNTSSRPGSKSKRKKKKSPEMIEFPAPFPLSYDEVYTRDKTVEAKCMSTMWTNYMQAGKSAFAPS